MDRVAEQRRSGCRQPPVIEEPKLGETLASACPSAETLSLLAGRRSTVAKLLGPPGPSQAELALIFRVGARVPDHRRLMPWRFVVIRGEATHDFRLLLEDCHRRRSPCSSRKELAESFEKSTGALRAPIIVCVVSTVRDDSEPARRTPAWEQRLSAGAVCQNLLLAASASGYAAQWITEWYAYEPRVLRALGLSEAERVAGFVCIGTASQEPLERQRPRTDDLVTFWEPDQCRA